MSIKKSMQSFRLSILERTTFAAILLLLASCTLPTMTPTPSPVPPVTASVAPSVTSSPTITPTLAPTLTPWKIDMQYAPSIIVTFDATNAMQHCLLIYFDITVEPGQMHVWRRDNGGYFECVRLAQ